jgi:hypothetical protein
MGLKLEQSMTLRALTSDNDDGLEHSGMNGNRQHGLTRQEETGSVTLHRGESLNWQFG